ncbi:MAG: DUF1819 domain-containing protein [Clostridiales bacterium]|nr:MAG: DUF1819 domain-containing protein [Clostridiales bacterium]
MEEIPVPRTYAALTQYRAFITREPFLFYEMRTTARLLYHDVTDDAAIEQIIRENLFQYPTEKSIRRMARACVVRLRNMHDDTLIAAIAEQPQDVAKQVCLYAMMKQHRLVQDFMLTVIGEKYRLRDFTFNKMELNVFFLRLQEQDDAVAAWSDSTIAKLKQIFVRILVDTEYLDSVKADHLNPVLISTLLEKAIRLNGDEAMLPAFNCFQG